MSLKESIYQPDQHNEILKDADQSVSTCVDSKISENVLCDDMVTRYANLLEKCKEQYSEQKLDDAYRTYEHCNAIKSNAQGQTLAQIEAIYAKDKKILDTFEEEYTYMKRILNEMEDQKDWIADSVGKTSKIYYKLIPNTELVSLKMDMELDVPLQTMLTLIYEITLWDHWVPFIKRTAELKKLHRASKVYYMELGIPYPLSNREIHMAGFGVNRLDENGSVLILAKSVDKDQEFLTRHNVQKVEKSGTVGIDMHFGGFELTPVGREKCKLRGIINMNPNFKYLPVSLINFFFKKSINFIMSRLVSKAKKFKGSVWEKETQKEEKREFYEWLGKIMEEHYQTLQKEGLMPQ